MNLVEFRAGKMTLKGRTVYPDKRKGLIYLFEGNNLLIHFVWKDRTTEQVEEEIIIFPCDSTFERVNECTTGRVYLLKIKSRMEKHFFWMQEPKTNKDDYYCRRVNEILRQTRPPSDLSGIYDGYANDKETQHLFNGLIQQEILLYLQGFGNFRGLSFVLDNFRINGIDSGKLLAGHYWTMSTPPTSEDPPSLSPASPVAPASPVLPASPMLPASPVPATNDAEDQPTTSANPASAMQSISAHFIVSDLRRLFTECGLAPSNGEVGAESAPDQPSAADGQNIEQYIQALREFYNAVSSDPDISSYVQDDVHDEGEKDKED